MSWLKGLFSQRVSILDQESVISVEQLEFFKEENRCSHCGGWHHRACPRVRRIKFRAPGDIEEIEFWESWPRDGVVFADELPLAQMLDKSPPNPA